MNIQFIEQLEAEIVDLKAKVMQGTTFGAWWTWTVSQFDDWCNTNLMTDTAIDNMVSLPVALRTNLKSNNAFVRNAGRVLIIIREVAKWLIRNII